MPWALTMFGPDGALIVMVDLPLSRMNPGVASPVVYWPTIVPLSLMPKAVADVPPLGMKVFTLPRDRGTRCRCRRCRPPTPAALIPKAMAVVDPLMFRGWSVLGPERDWR